MGPRAAKCLPKIAARDGAFCFGVRKHWTCNAVRRGEHLGRVERREGAMHPALFEKKKKVMANLLYIYHLRFPKQVKLSSNILFKLFFIYLNHLYNLNNLLKTIIIEGLHLLRAFTVFSAPLRLSAIDNNSNSVDWGGNPRPSGRQKQLRHWVVQRTKIFPLN